MIVIFLLSICAHCTGVNLLFMTLIYEPNSATKGKPLKNIFSEIHTLEGNLTPQNWQQS